MIGGGFVLPAPPALGTIGALSALVPSAQRRFGTPKAGVPTALEWSSGDLGPYTRSKASIAPITKYLESCEGG